jgi:hypothetical protein
MQNSVISATIGRKFASAILTIALLLPSFAGFVVLALPSDACSRMNCCKRGEHSRCSHCGGDGASRTGWVNLPCHSGCSLTAGLPTLLSAVTAEFREAGIPALAIWFLRLHPKPANASNDFAFALFGRPPPRFPVSRG